MKLITLNTWGGRAGREKVLSFFEKYMDVDVFCLQEIWSAPYEHLEGKVAGGLEISHENVMVYGMQDIEKALPNHDSYFHPHHLDNYGLQLLVKKDSEVVEHGEVFVHKDKDHVPIGDAGHCARNIQYVTIERDGNPITIINFHGLWNGKGKTDSEERLLQSAKILEFVQGVSGEVILCGDFNLMPDTQSIKLFEEYGLRNLIKESNIESTRTSHYTKPHKLGDYIFVSKGIEVKNFGVLPEEVSDHLALQLEF